MYADTRVFRNHSIPTLGLSHRVITTMLWQSIVFCYIPVPLLKNQGCPRPLYWFWDLTNAIVKLLWFFDGPISILTHLSLVRIKNEKNKNFEIWRNSLEVKSLLLLTWFCSQHSYGGSQLPVIAVLRDPNFFYGLWRQHTHGAHTHTCRQYIK